ncbi:MAG: response regulator [Candidatus Acidiferrales bacterium]
MTSETTTNEPVVKLPTILCIDDEPDAIQIRRLLLESEGYHVLDAPTGEEGLRLFQSNKIDAVIVDYWMSGMNGLVVAREIKKLKPAVPIIVLSGFPELPGEAVGLADRWILKGRSAQDLLDAIAALTQEQ